MKSLWGTLFCFLVSLLAAIPAGAVDQPVFGPVKYDVKARYGKQNRYTATFAAKDAVYLIQLQNGATANEKVDWWEFSVNGETVVRNGKYFYSFFAVFVKLKSENTIEVIMRDDVPSALRRPPATPKNIIVSVFPITAPGYERLRGAFGLPHWNQLNAFVDVILKIQGPALSLAMDAVSVQHDVARRSETFRKLADLKDRSAESFFERVLLDLAAPKQVRAEAALALGFLGDKKHIPLLMLGFVDPEELVNIASARALAFYPEKDTQELLTKTLARMDDLRKEAALHAIVNAGWKPVGTLTGLADSSDSRVAETALGMLGGMQTTAATEYLLAALRNPGKRDPRAIIRALGDTKDSRAVDALLSMAADASQRRGNEVDLADALAKLGDQRAAAPIQDMIKQATSFQVANRLRTAYAKLTGKDL